MPRNTDLAILWLLKDLRFTHLKKSRLAILAPKFVVDHTIEDASIFDATSRVVAAMISHLRVHALANVIELLEQTHVTLQTTPILDSRLLAWLHDQLKLSSYHACLLGFK
ncbi:hypothetical protein TNCV_231901 [Trichonephila clavipes]|nr:hypothetical protein TNCV_231901 [Trichonephila clavipes]